VAASIQFIPLSHNERDSSKAQASPEKTQNENIMVLVSRLAKASRRKYSKYLKDKTESKKGGMARLAGFEPATTWFEARYSIQLSYSRIAR
jgi:hypothetical protein